MSIRRQCRNPPSACLTLWPGAATLSPDLWEGRLKMSSIAEIIEQSKQGEERRVMMQKEIFLGNGAIALGLLEAGCQVVTSYPGTPSSEILPEVVRLIKSAGLNTYVEWSTNEKVAF